MLWYHGNHLISRHDSIFVIISQSATKKNNNTILKKNVTYYANTKILHHCLKDLDLRAYKSKVSDKNHKTQKVRKLKMSDRRPRSKNIQTKSIG